MKNQVSWKQRELERERAEKAQRKMNAVRIVAAVFYLLQFIAIAMIYLSTNARYGFVKPIFYVCVIAGLCILSSWFALGYAALRTQPGWKSEFERTQWLVNFVENAEVPITISGVAYPDHYVLDPQELKHLDVNADEKQLVLKLEDAEGQEAGIVVSLSDFMMDQIKKRQAAAV